MTIAEAFKVFGTALNVEFTNEQSVAEVLSAIAVRFGGTAKQTIADAANEIAKVADHITAIGDATLVTKSITDNGTYNASDDNADGYSKVNVNVPGVEFNNNPDIFTLLQNIRNLSVDIPSGVTSIGANAFSGCTGLKSITIPDSVTIIGNTAFSGCTGLTSIDIPSGVTFVGSNAFFSCTGLTSIDIPNSVTSIGVSAFMSCTGLTSIDIPSSVLTIGSNAFSGCTNLAQITINKAEGSISGAPWGAPNATVVWDG